MKKYDTDEIKAYVKHAPIRPIYYVHKKKWMKASLLDNLFQEKNIKHVTKIVQNVKHSNIVLLVKVIS